LNDKGRAFQIGEAVQYANKYYYAISGNTPPTFSVIYPSTQGTCYVESNRTIHITENDDGGIAGYEDWDEIMHEFGHFVEYRMDLINVGPDASASSHRTTDDLRARYDKTTGCHMAWYEGWASFYCQMAQEFYSNFIGDINTVNDDYYTFSKSNQSINVRNNEMQGEGCEGDVTALLINLHDSDDMTGYDNISL